MKTRNPPSGSLSQERLRTIHQRASSDSLGYSRDLLRRRDSYDSIPSVLRREPRKTSHSESFHSPDYDLPINLRIDQDLDSDVSTAGSVLDFGANLRRTRPRVRTPHSEPIREPRPELPDFDVDDSSEFQSALGNWLESHLIVSPTERTKYFLPLDVLDTILDRDLVGRLAPKGISREVLCYYVCGPPPEIKPATTTDTISSRRPPRTARKILAILILLQRPNDITKFLDDMVHDGDLPLRRFEQRGAQFRLGRSNGKEVSCFDEWKTRDIRQFDDFQWYMLSPFFTKSQHGRPLFYRLHDRVILPWVDYLLAREGGSATIHKTKIHAAHHNFSLTTNDYVAVKQLRYSDRLQFDAELLAFQNLSPHNHLVNLLSSFNYQSSYFFIFEWANGGNLSDLWHANPKAPGVSDSVGTWFLEQCAGLANALSTIHNATRPKKAQGRRIGASTTEETDEKDLLFGRHGDIKPENILWFYDEKWPKTDEEQSAQELCRGTLKIGDFGLTEFHSDKTRSNVPAYGVGMSLTYRAPELDTEKSLSRAYDIWSMGCLYLEFITWLLLGLEGVNEFSRGRLNNHGLGIVEDSYFIITQSKKTSAKVPRLNPFVAKVNLCPLWI
jgi:serine/threonine protein kinase